MIQAGLGRREEGNWVVRNVNENPSGLKSAEREGWRAFVSDLSDERRVLLS